MQEDPLTVAAAAARRGGLIVYPTDTLWGLGAAIDQLAAVRRVFEVKQRPATMPLSIALADVKDVETYASVPEAARPLLRLLPGAVTILLPRKPSVPSVVTGGRAEIGIRVPDHAECRRLIARSGPLTTTSANLHGKPEPRTLDEIRAAFGNRVDYYLKAGSEPSGRASTIIDASTGSVRIVRVGEISESRIRELLVD